MPDSRDQFFGDLFNEGAEQTHHFYRQLSFENRAVRRVFNECGVKVRSMGRLVNLCRDDTGNPDLSFSWFNAFFTRFPARLAGKKITYVGKRTNEQTGQRENAYLYQLTVLDAFQQKYNKIVTTLSRAMHRAAIDTSQPFVFLFPIVRTMFCAHNLDIPSQLAAEQHRAQLVFEYEKTRLVIERSATLLNAIGPDWYEEL
jgi:hypothetical protein